MAKNHILEHSRRVAELIKERRSNKAVDYTEDELNLIAQYEGFGGVGANADEGDVLSEFYTPTDIIDVMWRLACKHGFEGGKVLEPSCGTARFFGSPYKADNCELYGLEMNAISATIAQILYPAAHIKNLKFEQLFISGNKSIGANLTKLQHLKPDFDLVIGNPPYGDFSGFEAGLGEQKHTQARDYVSYFITRSLDMLQSGGLLCFIVGGISSTFLGNGDNKCKEAISQKADLVDAYQLPQGAFPNTDVISQILLFRKK